MIVPKETCRSSKENDILPMEGEQIIDVPHIDFVLVDQRLKLGYCDLMMQLQHMTYQRYDHASKQNLVVKRSNASSLL